MIIFLLRALIILIISLIGSSFIRASIRCYKYDKLGGFGLGVMLTLALIFYMARLIFVVW